VIPVFADSQRTRIAHVYNGLTINQRIGGSNKDIVEINNVRVQTQFQHIREIREYESGLEPYGAYKRGKLLILQGVVRASSWGSLYDRVEEVAAAFDPATVSRENPDTFGYLPYDFSVPTADVVNFPTGMMPCRYYVRAEEAFDPPLSQYAGMAVPFSLPLLAADPRRYRQSLSSLDGAGTADNSIGTFYSWPTVTIVMSGAGSATFAVGNTTAASTLTLDLSGRANDDAIVIDMERRAISLNGVDAPELYVSGDYWPIEAGNNVVTLANNTNASVTTTWRSAFSN